MPVTSDIGLSLKVTTQPNLFSVDESNQRFWQRFVLHDAISAFTPYADMVVPDVGGLFNERYFFTEGLIVNARLGIGTPRYGYISHDFTWDEYQMDSETTKEAQHPVGDATFVLDSRFTDDDSPKSRSFGDVKISKAVQQAMASYNLNPLQPVGGFQTKGKLIIVETSNSMPVVQPDETDAQLVRRLAQVAFNTTYDTTGYVAFWNLRNEFYFAPVGYLLKQKPVATLTMTQDKTTLENPEAIKNYGLYMGGVTVNRDSYNRNLWSINDAGTLTARATTIDKHLFRASPRDKVSIARSRLQTTRSNDLFGVATKKDQDALRAYSNHLGLESNFAYRYEVMVPFHPDLVTGHTVELVIGSASPSLRVAPEYSGVWLIVGSDHHYDVDGYGASRLTLGRGTLNIRKDHPLASTFT